LLGDCDRIRDTARRTDGDAVGLTALDSSPPVEYKGYEIVTRAYRRASDSYWHATYHVQALGDGREGVTGAISGAFTSSEEAGAAAIDAGKFWIDRHTRALICGIAIAALFVASILGEI